MAIATSPMTLMKWLSKTTSAQPLPPLMAKPSCGNLVLSEWISDSLVDTCCLWGELWWAIGQGRGFGFRSFQTSEACVLRNPLVHSMAAHEIGHGLSQGCSSTRGVAVFLWADYAHHWVCYWSPITPQIPNQCLRHHIRCIHVQNTGPATLRGGTGNPSPCGAGWYSLDQSLGFGWSHVMGCSLVWERTH